MPGHAPNGDMRMALLVPAGLAARQGLPGTPATRPGIHNSTSCPRSIPDPRDRFASIGQRLAAGTLLRFPW
jgi:hypothetical protein